MDKSIYSTIMKPEEFCDLQPHTECHIATTLVPHLHPRKICETVPKEFCHTKLDSPKMVTKPVKMKWCTYPNGNSTESSSGVNENVGEDDRPNPRMPENELVTFAPELVEGPPDQKDFE